ncbi:hypothetical protein [Aquimarina brevivitae]|uniref:Outer membrane protein with beta-barrel domain n=1 Tax=Aquimarina brevivitae TaxID=323412 RepID=A0A4Q7NY53_9FLAO|nr:hypothetical protein [Aquimarina brevivitae]RZS91878.1 hypothetical protein EV197_2981 [Aquimarina brevivitae]
MKVNTSIVKIIGCIILFSTQPILAQEEEERIDVASHRHKLGIYTGYSWIPEGRDPETNKKEFIVAPSFGIAYEYWFTKRWAIGTYNNIEIINIEVEKSDNVFIERENVLVISLGLAYQVVPKLSVSIGGGIESDENETLGVVRIGSEFIVLEHRDWELSVALDYLHKEIYDVGGVGFVLSKKF